MSKLKSKQIKNILITADTPKGEAATISLFEKECTYLADMVKEVNVLIKDKTKQITIEQLLEQAAHGLLTLRISAKFARYMPFGDDFHLLNSEDDKYITDVIMSKQECLELRHRKKANIVRDDKATIATRDNLYVLKPDKDTYIQKIKEEYQEQSKLESNNSDAPLPFLLDHHKHFAPELKIAVEAWLEIFADEKTKHNKGVEPLLKEWLKKHNHVLTATQIKRIATIITPESRKEGGAKKI